MAQKRAAAIHDISCFGRCSLTVALPILSAAGVETAVIPTAVLSTHTGGFKDYTVRDLSEEIVPIARHWKSENITVDAVYTGYLCSKYQIYLAVEAARLISREGTVFICDPVMADNGRLYSGFDVDYPKYMLKLCAEADIITPNITEAALMLGLQYREGPYTEDYINALLEGMYLKTHSKIVLTGVYFDERKIGAAVYDGESKAYVFADKLNAAYHGTGDIFASTLTAALLNDRSLKAAAQIAANFTCGCIRKTMESGTDMRYGVNFESQIPNLIKYLEL
ncbi:MAG: pyridoxamine kinase [Acutalibacteraceae bacterium]